VRRLNDRTELARLLAEGAVVLLPTDTLPGFHCRADRADAVERLTALKRRSPRRPLLLLCASAEQAFSLAAPLAPRVDAYAQSCWPGPFTLVLPSGPAAPLAVTAGTGGVACRVPDLAPLRELIAAAGFPLVSTSANLSGQPPCADLAEAARQFGSLVDAVGEDLVPEPHRPPGLAPGQASALADLTVWPPLLLRAGPRPLPPWPSLEGVVAPPDPAAADRWGDGS
jgi:L-threonylcarbamoyladenylate synthase